MPGEAAAPGGTPHGGTAEEAAPQGKAPGAQSRPPRQEMPGEAAAPGGTPHGGTAEEVAPRGRTAREADPHGGTPPRPAAQEADARDGTVPERDGSPASPTSTAVEPGGPATATANRWLFWLRRRPDPPAPADTGTDPEAGTPDRAANAPAPSAARARGPEPAAGPDPAADAPTPGRAAGPEPVAPARAAGRGRSPEHAADPQPVAPGSAAGARDGAGPAASPAPVLPGVPVAPRPAVRPLAVSDDVAGVPCPACGTPNPPDRRFCRRCAAPLTPSTTAAPLPWWRTVWPFRRRTRAGSGRLVRFLVVLTVVLALCAAGFLLLPAGRHLVQDTLDKLGKAKAVTPARALASAELPGHPVGQSTDGLSNRYWAAPGPGASATYTFGKPFRLVAVIITNGASPAPEEYAKQGRALRIDMEVTDRNGATVHKALVLSDKPGPQTFPTGISDVATVRLTLQEPAGSAPEHRLALAEVEFFQRS
ncbi:NADase-type glycan-binding domain-containing protein [Streptomyces sp. NRRL S-378]|uniref:NADase-type glycan-binding domain-containing protein n=1 Tax=Streptomyces sp. NRRL S-378 TaxID=1463904 RepID=UPI001F45AEE0|nr:zinc ribbon domain-containing protein [Streptomyces sp. NRRL S-378]